MILSDFMAGYFLGVLMLAGIYSLLSRRQR